MPYTTIQRTTIFSEDYRQDYKEILLLQRRSAYGKENGDSSH